MYISIFDLFKIGIGPSSSHTVGPIIASNMLIEYLQDKDTLKDVINIDVELFGSLAYTGEGHKSYDALIIGLHSIKPDEINNDIIKNITSNNNKNNKIELHNKHIITFNKKNNIILNKKYLHNYHSNAIKYIITYKFGI